HTRCLSDWSSDVCSSDLVSPLFVFLPAAIFHCTIRNGRRVTWISLFLGTAIAGGVVAAGASSPQITGAEAHMSVAYLVALILSRSEERRVGKGGRSRGER